MIQIEHFTKNDIPYAILERFGLTRTMIDDMPQAVMTKLLSSKKTPVMPIICEGPDGQKTLWPASLSLKRKDDGSVDVFFAPVFKSNDLEGFSQEVQDVLRQGGVTRSPFKDKSECYVQMNNDINQVMAVDANIVSHNIQCFADNYGLDRQQLDILLDGNVLEVNTGGRTISIGIDLNESLTIRICNGNAIQWIEEADANRLPRFSFGTHGCWTADDNNQLSYIPQEEYTEEMKNLHANLNGGMKMT